MNIITSLIPKKDAIQQKCIKSWLDCGFQVYSINIKNEWDSIKRFYKNVTLVEAKNTAITLHNSKIPYPSILDVLNFVFNNSSPTLITNSDILLDISKTQQNNLVRYSSENLIFGNRIDVDTFEDKEHNGVIYGSGFDWFVIHPNFEHLFISTRKHFCIGQPFWDYWIPVTFIRKGLKPALCMSPIAFHKIHDTNWSDRSFYLYGKLLSEDIGFDIKDQVSLNKFTKIVLSTIMNNSKICQIREN